MDQKEAIETNRESQFTALQLVVAALAHAMKDDPNFKRALADVRRMERMHMLSPEDKAKVVLSIDRLTGT